MSHSEILILNEKRETLKREISVIKEALLNEDDPEQELVWEGNLRSKENTLNDVTDKIEDMQTKIQNDFVRNIINKRNVSLSQNSDIFAKARADTENTIYNCLIMKSEEIARGFSTDLFEIRPESGTQVYPKKVEFSWFHEFRSNGYDKIIPLSPGVEQPFRYCRKTKKRKKVLFYIDKLYNDPQFIKRCNEYYDQYNLSLKIKQDRQNRNKYWISLNILEDGRLIFP